MFAGASLAQFNIPFNFLPANATFVGVASAPFIFNPCLPKVSSNIVGFTSGLSFP